MPERKFKELAERLSARRCELEGGIKRPALRLVQSPESAGMDALMRESHCRMIRHLRRRWGHPMQMLIDQACFGLPGIESLDDDALVALHRDLERAEECLRDGIAFEDAGLLRSRYG